MASTLLGRRAMAQTREHDDAPEVTIVSANPETLDGLQTYFRGVGVSARCTRDLVRCAAAATRALILFPDDFRWEQVVATLAELSAERPDALPVLVTAHPQRFERLKMPDGVLLLPRPAWGWTLLDAIRSQLKTSASATTKGGRRAR
jgi:hypothetical protein